MTNPVKLYNLKEHDEYADELMLAIDQLCETRDDIEIHKGIHWADHHLNEKLYEKKFRQLIQPYLINCAKEHYGCDMAEFRQFWFSRVRNSKGNGWHTHGQTNMSGVYYLEMPKKKYVTSFWDKSVEIDATEGDFILFPSHMLHACPPIDEEKKTVISFDWDIYLSNHLVSEKWDRWIVDYEESIYAKGTPIHKLGDKNG